MIIKTFNELKKAVKVAESGSILIVAKDNEIKDAPLKDRTEMWDILNIKGIFLKREEK